MTDIEVVIENMTPEIVVEIVGSGTPGEKGEKGDKGDPGKDGTMSFEDLTPAQRESLRGEPGKDGVDGKDGYTPIKGVDYFDGVDGKDGYTPVKGVDYFDGEKGDKGERGEKGEQGIQGEQGVQGERGEQGIQGIQGIPGDKGDKGDKGDTGAKGDDYILTDADKQDIAQLFDPSIESVKAIADNNKHAIDAINAIIKGIRYVFETDTSEAYSVPTPSGAVAADLWNMGGKSVAIDGEIVSTDVDELEVRGRNIYQGITDGSAYCDIGETIPIGTQITFSCDITEVPEYSLYYYDENIEYINSFAVRTGTIGSRFSQTITATKPIRYVFKPTADQVSNIQIEKGATATQFAPYSVQNTPIPTAIRNLPCYGCGVNGVYNEVDFVNKKYVQRVDMLELNVDDMNNSEDFPGWRTVPRIREICGIGVNDTIEGLHELGTKIGVNTTGAYNTVFFAKWIYGLTQSEWKTRYAGTTLHLYIKRVEPIITDISDLLDNRFENIKVEGGGSLTFHQSTGQHLPVKNTVDYLINLQEVTT